MSKSLLAQNPDKTDSAVFNYLITKHKGLKDILPTFQEFWKATKDPEMGQLMVELCAKDAQLKKILNGRTYPKPKPKINPGLTPLVMRWLGVRE